MRQRNAKRRAFSVENLEDRICLDGSVGWDGPGLEGAHLTYYIAGTLPNVTITQFEDAIVKALNTWGSVADLTFSRTSLPNQPNSIDISVRPIDGPYNVLAYAYFPKDVNNGRFAGDLVFDEAELWEFGNEGGPYEINIAQTAVHELGHALGLDHSDVATAVMFPTQNGDEDFTALDPTDEAAILGLYGPAKPATIPQVAAPAEIQDDAANERRRPAPPRLRRLARHIRPRHLAAGRNHPSTRLS